MLESMSIVALLIVVMRVTGRRPERRRHAHTECRAWVDGILHRQQTIFDVPLSYRPAVYAALNRIHRSKAQGSFKKTASYWPLNLESLA